MTIKASNFPTTRPTLNLDFAKTKQLDPRVTFSRASSGTYVDVNGVIQSAASGVARFDHNPTTGESLGLLVEESRTNLATYSENMQLAWTASQATFGLASPSLSPSRNNAAYKLIPSTANAPHYISASRISSDPVVVSVFVKADGYSKIAVINSYGSWVLSKGVVADLSTGTLLAGSQVGSFIKPFPDGWFQITTGNLSAAVFDPRIVILDDSYPGTATDPDIYTYAGNGTSGIYIWGAQLEASPFPTSYIPTPATFTSRASTATFYDANGVIQTAASGVARSNAFFPDSNGVMRPAGLLLEAAGTNLVTYSEQFDNAAWTKNGSTITANSVAAPDSTTTADKIVESSGTSRHEVYVSNVASTTSGSTYTLSVFAKAAERSILQLAFNTVGYPTANFNLATGVVSLATSATASMQKLGNGWYRCSMTAVSALTPLAAAYIGVQSSATAPFPTEYAGDGASGIHIWGAQLEASPYPTSYIPTTTATVTRAADVSTSSTVTRSADVASITGSNFSSWYNQSEGTVFSDLKSNYQNGIGAWSMHTGTSTIVSNSIHLTQSSLNRYEFQVYDGITQVSLFSTGIISASASNRIATAYSVNNYAVSFNGLTPSVDTSGTLPVSLSTLSIGRRTNNSSTQMSGTISRLTYWPTRLSDATLQALTR
jgi:hypothetical protein